MPPDNEVEIIPDGSVQLIGTLWHITRSWTIQHYHGSRTAVWTLWCGDRPVIKTERTLSEPVHASSDAMKTWDQKMAGELKLGLGLAIREMLAYLETGGYPTLYVMNPHGPPFIQAEPDVPST